MRPHADAGGCFPTGGHYPGIAHLIRAAVQGTIKAFSSEAELMDLPVVSVDVEATGLDPQSDRLVEVACVIFKAERIERRVWLINPGIPIPAEAQAVHKISDADVEDAPRFESVAEEVLEVMNSGIPLAYNAEFDRTFLAAELKRALGPRWNSPGPFARGVLWIDPLIWARELQRQERSKALGAVCERLGIEIGQAHRAADDAQAAGQVLRAFLQQPQVPNAYGRFIQQQRALGRAQSEEQSAWRS